MIVRMLSLPLIIACGSALIQHTNPLQQRQPSALNANKVGIIYGTASGSCADIAQAISKSVENCAPPLNIEDVVGKLGSVFEKYDCLIVGTPTYNTDADKRRSATKWDAVYYDEIANLAATGALKNKPVAVFGMGDQESYSNNFADATGELHDVFQNAGAKMFGYTSVKGYSHSASKSQRADKFVGLVIDNANQDELSDSRVRVWVQQLAEEGFLNPANPSLGPLSSITSKEEGVASSLASSSASISSSPGKSNAPVVSSSKPWHDYDKPTLAKSSFSSVEGEFKPFHSTLIKQTLWVSTKDPRNSFYTFDKASKD